MENFPFFTVLQAFQSLQDFSINTTAISQTTIEKPVLGFALSFANPVEAIVPRVGRSLGWLLQYLPATFYLYLCCAVGLVCLPFRRGYWFWGLLILRFIFHFGGTMMSGGIANWTMAVSRCLPLWESSLQKMRQVRWVSQSKLHVRPHVLEVEDRVGGLMCPASTCPVSSPFFPLLAGLDAVEQIFGLWGHTYIFKGVQPAKEVCPLRIFSLL